MELASKYNPADVEGESGTSIGWNTVYSVRNPMVVNLTPSSFRPRTSPVCCTWDSCLIIPFRIFLVRRARMEGKNACWVPGTDHASIATEAKKL